MSYSGKKTYILNEGKVRETDQNLKAWYKLSQKWTDLSYENIWPAATSCFMMQPSWDKAYENLYPLWRGYHYCVDNARTRNARRKSSSLKRLDVPGKKVRFSSSDRNLMKTERPDLIKFIRWTMPRITKYSEQFAARTLWVFSKWNTKSCCSGISF